MAEDRAEAALAVRHATIRVEAELRESEEGRRRLVAAGNDVNARLDLVIEGFTRDEKRAFVRFSEINKRYEEARASRRGRRALAKI